MTSYIHKHRKTLFAVLSAATGLSLVLFRLTSFSDWIGLRATWRMLDFETAIYYPVVAFLAGENPYDTAAYLAKYPLEVALPLFLPSILLLHLPFGLLPLGLASLVYFIATLLMTFVLGYVSLLFTRQKLTVIDVLLIGGLILLTRPGHWNVLLGQLTLQFVLTTYIALYYAKHFPLISGLGLAISLIKPTFGIPVALLMLAQGYVRPVMFSGIIALIVNVPILLILTERAGGVDSFVSLLLHNHDVWQQNTFNDPGLSIIRVDVVALIGRFIQGPIGTGIEFTLFVVVLSVAGWTLNRGRDTHDERVLFLGIGIACLGILLCTYHQAYDLLLLALPIVAIVGRRFPELFYSSYHYPLSLMLLAVLAFNYAATSSVMRFIPQGGALWLSVVSINAVALLALLFLWIQVYKRSVSGRSCSLSQG